MNCKWIYLVVAAVLAGVMLSSMFVQAGQGETNVQWQYRAVLISDSYFTPEGRAKIKTKLDELGKQGWELVDFEESSYILKSPK